MKVLHVPFTYFPDPVGGTEIYVEQLARALSAAELDQVIVAPGRERVSYEHRGIRVERLEVENTVGDLEQLYGQGDAATARAFGGLLDVYKPTVLHLHAFTRIVSLEFVREAHARGIPVVFTYHTPTVSCQRSGLMRWGREECDGLLDATRCTACRLHSLDMPLPIAQIFAHMPPVVRAWATPRQGGVWTALRLHDLIEHQHAQVRALMMSVDCIVVLCEWSRKVLARNEVPPEKITFVPHGFTADDQVEIRVTHNPVQKDALRVVGLGRLEPIKGIDVLVHALAAHRTLPMTLDIYGIEQSEGESQFAASLRKSIARDPRVRLLPPVPHEEVVSLLRQYDILAVPSQWLETGPLVVLEAFAAGIPVIGSDLGGIREKVEDGVTGMLVPPLNVERWGAALARAAQDREFVERLRANISAPRSMEAVALEMTALYRSVSA